MSYDYIERVNERKSEKKAASSSAATTKYKSIDLFELKRQGKWNCRLEKLIKFLPDGAWIAGGFLRSMIDGSDELDGDVDIFFRDEKAFNEVVRMIRCPKSHEISKVFGFYVLPDDYETAKIVDCESLIMLRPNLQLIRIEYFKDPIKVINDFDFRCCQLITNGRTLWYGEHTFEDIERRQININKKTGDAVVRLNRILRYKEKGYKIQDEILNKTAKSAKAISGSYEGVGGYADRKDKLKRAFEYLKNLPES